MENNILTTSFIKYPGVIECSGKIRIAFINLCTGQILRIDKEEIGLLNKDDYHKELENQNIGICVNNEDPILDYEFSFPYQNSKSINVQILDNFDNLKYISH